MSVPMENVAKNNRILFVEDDLDLRDSVSAYLVMAGFDVTGVGSCLECYAQLPGSSFSVAIVDVSLPDQSGFVLAEFLRANTTMKIIMLTALERIDDRVRGYAAGAHNYFVKPVDARELLAAVSSLTLSGYGDPEKGVGEEHPGTAWKLIRKSWQLITPDGTGITLTSLELMLIDLLAAVPGRVVNREALIRTLYNREDEHSGRALDSLLRRLRSKITSSGHQSPIKTAHSVGHCFAEPVVVI